MNDDLVRLASMLDDAIVLADAVHTELGKRSTKGYKADPAGRLESAVNRLAASTVCKVKALVREARELL